MPGLVALVSRNDDVHVETLGTLAFGNPAPMRRDTIFRIASLSKPITAVAAMILVEECKLRLDESVEPWLPELANRRVLKSISSQLDDTVPAKRAITVRDLLTFRMGFGSVMAMPGTYPIQKLIRDYQIGGDGPPLPAQRLPRQNGSTGSVRCPGCAARRAMVVSRQLGRARGFDRPRVGAIARHVPAGARLRSARHERHRLSRAAEKIDRLPVCLLLQSPDRHVDVVRRPAEQRVAPSRRSNRPGAGSSRRRRLLCLQPHDAGQGRHGREQIISLRRRGADDFGSTHVGERAGAEIFFGTHRSWGFGMAVDIQRNDIFRTPGRFGWDGGLGTSAYTDPAEGMIGILFTPAHDGFARSRQKFLATSGLWLMERWNRQQAAGFC